MKSYYYILHSYKGPHSNTYNIVLKQLYTFSPLGITVLSNIKLLIYQSRLSISQASATIKSLDTHMSSKLKALLYTPTQVINVHNIITTLIATIIDNRTIKLHCNNVVYIPC